MPTYYTTTGEERGCCGHKHRSIRKATKCARKDMLYCQAHCGRSDREVVALESDGAHRQLDSAERIEAAKRYPYRGGY